MSKGEKNQCFCIQLLYLGVHCNYDGYSYLYTCCNFHMPEAPRGNHDPHTASQCHHNDNYANELSLVDYFS